MLQLLCFYKPCSKFLQLRFEGEGGWKTETIILESDLCITIAITRVLNTLNMVMSATSFRFQCPSSQMPYLPLKLSVKKTLMLTEMAFRNALSHSMLALQPQKHLFQICLSASSKDPCLSRTLHSSLSIKLTLPHVRTCTRSIFLAPPSQPLFSPLFTFKSFWSLTRTDCMTMCVELSIGDWWA